MALLRCGAQVALVVDRPLRRRGTLQHAQFGQQFAYQHGFRPGQRQVMRTPRVGKLRPLAAARIAARLGLELENGEIIASGPGQPPAGRQAGNAGADDQYAAPPGCADRRQGAIAQTMAQRMVHAQQFAGRQGRFSGGRASGQGSGPDQTQEIPPISQIGVATG